MMVNPDMSKDGVEYIALQPGRAHQDPTSPSSGLKVNDVLHRQDSA